LLAGLPLERPAALAGSLAILALALLAGWAVLRTVPQTQAALPGDAWRLRLIDCAAAAGLAGALLAALTGLAAGDLGRDALRGVGAAWWAVGLSGASLVLLAAAFWLGVQALRGRLAERAGPGLYLLRSAPDAEPAEAAEQPRTQQPEAAAQPAVRSRNAS
jgi:hypothetical protein